MPSILKHQSANTIKFKPLKFKNQETSYSITPNLYVLFQHLTKTQQNLFIYIILQSNSTNYININTILITKYIGLNKLIQRQHIVHKGKNKKSIGNYSYNNVVKDLIYLIDIHAVIQLKPGTKHYVINPAYSYVKSRLGITEVVLNIFKRYDKALEGNNLTYELRVFGVKYWLSAFSKTGKDVTDVYSYKRALTKNMIYGKLRLLARDLVKWLDINEPDWRNDMPKWAKY